MKIRARLIILGREEGLKCKIYVDGTSLGQVKEFKYFGCDFEESVIDGADCVLGLGVGGDFEGWRTR